MQLSIKCLLLIFAFGLFGSTTPSFAQEQQERLVERKSSSEETYSLEEEGTGKEKKKKNKGDKDKKDEEITIDIHFATHLLINLLTALVIIVFIYNRNYHKTELLFTFFAFNLVIFLLTYVMNHVKLSLGAAFGLFAVFSMLRYRTEGISPKDMTYLFIVIATGLICAIKLDEISLLAVCLLLCLFTWVLDGNVIFKKQFSKEIVYDNIQLIKPERNLELIQDLKNRTGLNVYKISVARINFLRDEATLEVFYHD